MSYHEILFKILHGNEQTTTHNHTNEFCLQNVEHKKIQTTTKLHTL